MSGDRYTINAGKRVLIETPEFRGRAGLVDRRDGSTWLSFIPNQGLGRTKVGSSVIVEGTARLVEVVERSDNVQGMLLIRLAPIE